MRLVIIRHDAADQVSLASGDTFADAGAVRAELVRLIRDGLLDADGVYSLVDLDAAAPLVVVGAPLAASADAALDEPRSDAEAFFSDGLPEPPVAVVAEPVGDTVEVEEPFASGVLEEIAAVDEAPAGEPDPDEAPAGEPDPAGADAPQQWPWDLPGAEDAEAEDAPAAEEAVETGLEAAPADEPADDSAEDPALNEDLAAVAASLAEKMSEEPSLVSEPIRLGDGVGDGVELDLEIADPDEMTIAEPQGVLDAAAEDAPAAADVDPPAIVAADAEADQVYEPGALNMEAYTCDDCVYVNTCPNQHQKKPAECGSFQWKSV